MIESRGGRWKSDHFLHVLGAFHNLPINSIRPNSPLFFWTNNSNGQNGNQSKQDKQTSRAKFTTHKNTFFYSKEWLVLVIQLHTSQNRITPHQIECTDLKPLKQFCLHFEWTQPFSPIAHNLRRRGRRRRFAQCVIIF